MQHLESVARAVAQCQHHVIGAQIFNTVVDYIEHAHTA